MSYEDDPCLSSDTKKYHSSEDNFTCLNSNLTFDNLNIAVVDIPRPIRLEFTLTTEQSAILSVVRPPHLSHDQKILRVTAGAGTGKTTTLLEYSKQLIRHGYQSVKYLSFNKTAAAEANCRFMDPRVDCRTLHSEAFRCLNLFEGSVEDGSVTFSHGRPIPLIDDTVLSRNIQTLFESKIDEFILKMPLSCRLTKAKANYVIRKIVLYILKTLYAFLHSKKTFSEWKVSDKYAVYYPAQKYHEFEIQEPNLARSEYIKFYNSTAQELWSYMQGPKIKFRSFDSVMKQAQLGSFKINCQALLVDESQDMNGCQIAWIVEQHQIHKTHLFIVGDAVQTIYSFRGAKSSHLVNIPNCEDFFLTTSFRFGGKIAAVANCILNCKEFSPQRNLWTPYRLTGATGNRGIVTSNCLLSVRDGPVTILAPTNINLLQIALKCLLPPTLPADYSSPLSSSSSSPPPTPFIPPISSLKISINGKGEDSGPRKWKEIEKQLDSFLQVFTGQSNHLPYYPWNEEDKDDCITWVRVAHDVDALELMKFKPIVELITTFKESSYEVFKTFQSQVLSKAYSADEADVILSTIHAAKGMEWDRVQILDTSMRPLTKFKVEVATGQPQSPNSPSMQTAYQMNQQQQKQGQLRQLRAEMNWQSWGDEYNLWYVALTRAKKVLSTPPKFLQLMEDFIAIEAQVMAQTQVQVQAEPAIVSTNNSPNPSLSPCLSVHSNAEFDSSIHSTSEDCLTPSAIRRFDINGMSRELTRDEAVAIHRDVGQLWLWEFRRTLFNSEHPECWWIP